MANNFGIELNENGYFISYLSSDKDRVGKLCRELSTQLPIWNDGGIEIGGNWRKELAEHIGSCKGVIFFVTKKVFTTENYMTKEYKLATYNNKDVLFIFLDPIRPEELPPDGQAYYAEFVDLQYLDACDLSNKQIVEKIVDFSRGDKKVLEHVPSLRRYSKLFICLFLCACIGMGVIFFRKNTSPNVVVETAVHQENPDVDVEITSANNDDGSPTEYINSLYFGTTIENFSDKNLLIKNVKTNVSDITPIENVAIDYVLVTNKNVIKIFAYNLGWGNSDDLQKSLHYRNDYFDQETRRDLSEIANVNFNSNLKGVKSGEIEGYASLEFDANAMEMGERYYITIDDGGFEHISSYAYAEKGKDYCFCVTLLDDGSVLIVGGGGAPEILFSDKTYVDVDKLKNQCPLTINHTSADFLQQVDAGNNIILQSKFVFSKSCRFTCSSSITMGQDTFDSEEETYTVLVTRFDDYLWHDYDTLEKLKYVDITNHNKLSEMAKQRYFDSKAYFDALSERDSSN